MCIITRRTVPERGRDRRRRRHSSAGGPRYLRAGVDEIWPASRTSSRIYIYIHALIHTYTHTHTYLYIL